MNKYWLKDCHVVVVTFLFLYNSISVTNSYQMFYIIFTHTYCDVWWYLPFRIPTSRQNHCQDATDDSDVPFPNRFDMSWLAIRYHVLVLKKKVHKPGHFQYTILCEGKSFSCPRTHFDLPQITCFFSSFLNM